MAIETAVGGMAIEIVVVGVMVIEIVMVGVMVIEIVMAGVGKIVVKTTKNYSLLICLLTSLNRT
jgi:hypothetical protein